jgi:hypothetical protein
LAPRKWLEESRVVLVDAGDCGQAGPTRIAMKPMDESPLDAL